MKKFIIIGNGNAVTYKEIFNLIKNNELWLGASGIRDMAFKVPATYEMRSTRSWVDENGQNWRSLGNGCWFTNVEHKKRNTPIDLYKRYSNEYKHYDNFDAIECGKVADIPMDYNGIVGVPITFLDKYCPAQFDILGMTARWSDMKTKEYTPEEYENFNDLNGSWVIINNGVPKMGYKRVLIRKRTA